MYTVIDGERERERERERESLTDGNIFWTINYKHIIVHRLEKKFASLEQYLYLASLNYLLQRIALFAIFLVVVI
jgi:hypothetical protein